MPGEGLTHGPPANQKLAVTTGSSAGCLVLAAFIDVFAYRRSLKAACMLLAARRANRCAPAGYLPEARIIGGGGACRGFQCRLSFRPSREPQDRRAAPGLASAARRLLALACSPCPGSAASTVWQSGFPG
jgi:hypothetical protein